MSLEENLPSDRSRNDRSETDRRVSFRKWPAAPRQEQRATLLELSAGAESCVKCRRGRIKGESLHKLDRLGCTDHAVHAGVFPLHGEGAVISDGVEHAEAVFPGNVTVTGGDEVPAAARIGPGQVRPQAAVATVIYPALGVLAVDVEDVIFEVPQETHRVEVLPHKVARIPVNTKDFGPIYRFQSALGCPIVIGDFRGVYF